MEVYKNVFPKRRKIVNAKMTAVRRRRRSWRRRKKKRRRRRRRSCEE